MKESNFNYALEKLSHVKSVEEWNDCRDWLQSMLTKQQVASIDASGYIVNVLGQDM